MSTATENTTAVELQTRQFSLRADTADAENFSIDCVISTADAVRMWDWVRWEPIDEILTTQGRTEESHIPLLDSHDAYSVRSNLGHVVDIRTESEESVGRLLFDGATEAGRETFGKYNAGHLRSVSVGYIVTRHVTVDAGTTVEIEGVSYTAAAERSLRVALEWRLHEVSCVNIPADKGANVRQLEGVRSCQVTEDQAARLSKQQRQPSLPFPESTESTERSADDQLEPAAGRTSKETEMSDSTTVPADDSTRQAELETARTEARQAAVAEERERVTQLRSIAGDDVAPEVLQSAIDDGTDIETFRGLALENIRSQRNSNGPVGSDAPNILINSDRRNARDFNAQSMAAGLAMRLGVKQPELYLGRIDHDEITGETYFERPGFELREEARKEVERNMERGHQMRNMHSVDLCSLALRQAEIEVPLERRQIVTRAMSTPNVASIYTSATSAVLLQNLGNMMDSTIGWTAEREANSFKDQELHKLEGGRLSKRERGTKAKQAKFSDKFDTYSVSEFARTLMLDRQDIVDDEIGAWMTAMSEFARAILSVRPDVVYAVLLKNAALRDGTALFDAGHNNDLTGALSQAALQASMTAVQNQQNLEGVNLDLLANHLIVSSQKRFLAKQLTESAETRGTGQENGTANPLESENIIVHSDSRLTTGFTDPDDEKKTIAPAPDQWFNAAAMGAYGITFGTLAGTNGMPWMNTTVKNSDGVYGLCLDVAYVGGAGASDHRGIARSKP